MSNSADQALSGENRKILIVGDWFIDEYWFLARHHSEISSHTGPLHYRIFSDMHEPVRGLCGAGLVTRVLYELDNNYCLHGVGAWNKDDTDYLKHLIHAPSHNDKKRPEENGFCHATCAPFIIYIDKKISRNFVMHELSAKRLTLETTCADCATVRVIRQYRIEGDEFHQVDRIDWEPREKPQINNIPQLPSDCHALVIDDHKKGVISKMIVSSLVGNNQTPPRLYVRTKNKDIIKDHRPEWFCAISDIRLLVLGPEVCCRHVPPGRLLTRGRHITRHVYEMLNNMKGIKSPRCDNIVLVSDELEVVALLGEYCFAGKVARSVKHTDLEGVGFTTSLFAVLIDALEKNILGHNVDENATKVDENATKLGELLSVAYEKARVPTPKSLRSAPKGANTSSKPNPPMADVWHLGDWSNIARDWQSAVAYNVSKSVDMGIIEKTQA